MDTEDIDCAVRDSIREIVADVVEIDVERIGWNSHFWDEIHADSMQGIEIVSALERRFGIDIDLSLLSEMNDVQSTYRMVMAVQRGTGPDAG
jgi:acyl carrier protein